MSENRIDQRQKLFFALSALVAVIFLLLIVNSVSASLLVHFGLGKLLYSTSNGAILFFLVLYILSAVIALAKRGDSLKRRSLPLLLLPAILLLGNFLNIWSFFLYRNPLRLPLKSHFYHWIDNVNSFCYLLHNHTGKTALAWIGKLTVGAKKLTAFDTGQVFSSYVPAPLTQSIALLLLLSLIVYLLSLPAFFRRYQYNIPLFLLYFFAVSSCVKSMVDGGPLTYRFFPSLIVLISLVFSRDTEDLHKKWQGRWAILLITVTLPVIFLWQQMSPEKGVSALAPFLFLCAVFALLLLLSKASPSLRQRGIIAILAGYLLLSTGVEFLLFDLSYFHRINPQDHVVLVDFSDFSMQDISENCLGLPVYQVYRQNGNDPLKPRNLFIWNDDDPGLHAMGLMIRVLDQRGGKGHFPEQDLIHFRTLKMLGGNTGVLHFTLDSAAAMPPIFSSTHATLFSRNNHYCYLHLLGRLLTRSGFKEFIMIPLAGNKAD